MMSGARGNPGTVVLGPRHRACTAGASAPPPVPAGPQEADQTGPPSVPAGDSSWEPGESRPVGRASAGACRRPWAPWAESCPTAPKNTPVYPHQPRVNGFVGSPALHAREKQLGAVNWARRAPVSRARSNQLPARCWGCEDGPAAPPAGHNHFHPLPHAREPAGPHFNYGKALTSLALMNYIKFKHVLKLYFINKKPWARFGDAAFSGEDAFIPVTPLASFQEHLSPPSPCASNISPRGGRSPGPPPPEHCRASRFRGH